jgi:hypothetical protein
VDEQDAEQVSHVADHVGGAEEVHEQAPHRVPHRTGGAGRLVLY